MRTESRANSAMSAIEFETRRWADGLVSREASRAGTVKPLAVRSVARRIGLAPGTLANVIRGRAKRLTAATVQAIRGAVIRELEAEIARLTHELELARASGADPRSDQIAEIETLLNRARVLLNQQV